MTKAFYFFIVLLSVSTLVSSCGKAQANQHKSKLKKTSHKTSTIKLNTLKINNQSELATFGGGCFWCTEAIFQSLKGVISVESGYAGGKVDNPSYKQVSSGTTGHAEVIRIHYNPKILSYNTLLDVFFSTHNPTTLNRQNADRGTQYRSVVFYHSEKQKNEAEKFIKLLEKEQVFEDPIVTEVTAINNYFIAENYHQNYYNNNKNQGYCEVVISPKLDKFRKKYKNLLKTKH